MSFFIPLSTPLTVSLNAAVGLVTWKARMNTLGNSEKFDPFQKKTALGFVNYRPLNQGLRPLFSQSKRLMTAITSSLAVDNVICSDTHLTGKWRKNAKLSDDTRELFDFVNLPWMLRKGEKFFRYLELERNDKEFRRTVNAGGFINVSEIYPMDGQSRKLKRRDLRNGTMDGKVERTDKGLRTVVKWSDPYGVSMEETFCLSNDTNELTVYTTATRPVNGEILKLKQVFTRM